MEKLKYIVYETYPDGPENSIVFPGLIGHDEMSRMVKATKVVGAGFCSFKRATEFIYETEEKNGNQEQVLVGEDRTLVINCFGNSHSLNIDSREEDSLKVTLDYLGFDHDI